MQTSNANLKFIEPEPGVYHDITNATYHNEWNAVNHSRLEWLDRSPRYCRAQMQKREEPTPAMILGSAVHAAILEPDTFLYRFIEQPDFGDMRSSTRKAERDVWIASKKAKGFTVLSAETMSQVQAMQAAAQSHPLAKKLLESINHVENSVVWTDKATGLLCKARPDALVDRIGVMLDLKTCRDSRPKAFASAFYDFGYWRQFPFYLAGLHAHGRNYARVVVVAVESEPPHDVRVYEVSEESIDLGHIDNCRLLELHARYDREGWPEHADAEAMALTLPDWAKATERKKAEGRAS